MALNTTLNTTIYIYIYTYTYNFIPKSSQKQVFFFPEVFFGFAHSFPIQNYVNKLCHARQYVQELITLSKQMS